MSSEFKVVDVALSPEYFEKFLKAPRAVRPKGFHFALWPEEKERQFLNMMDFLPKKLWVALNSKGKILGRVGASLALSSAVQGYVGFFECVDDDGIVDSIEHTENAERVNEVASSEISAALLRAASEYLKDLGCTQILGPINFSTWFPYRFLTLRTNSSLGFAWEPMNPPHYPSLFENFGFKVYGKYRSTGHSSLHQFRDKMENGFLTGVSAGFRMRELSGDDVNDETILKLLYQMTMVAFADNTLFEKIPFEFFKQIYVPAAKERADGITFIIETEIGEPAGYIYAFLDDGYLVLKTVCVLPKFRGQALTNALLFKVAERGINKNATKHIVALTQLENLTANYSSKTEVDWIHEYSLFSLV
jgi:GNAT superfamily N-acetyltransferase